MSGMRINGLGGLDSSEGSVARLGMQLAQRVQYIVDQVARKRAGDPADDIALELQTRLRRMGIIPNTRDVNQYAEKIAALQAGEKR